MDSQVVQNMFAADYGTPLEDYHIVSGTKIYEREFTKRKILVNPTSNEYTIQLDETYLDMDGQQITSITVPKYSGIILTKTS